MDRRTFSDLVSAIYDGAVDLDLWPETLGRICTILGFRKGTIDLNRLPGMTNLFNFHHGIDDRQAATMVSHYGSMPEVWGGLEAVLTRPIERPWVVSRIISQESLRQTSYYRNWVGPMELVDGAAIVLARDPDLFGSIRLATDARRGFIDDALVDELAALLPHCQRAARINGLLEASRSVARSFQAVVDAMSLPIVLVASDCTIVHANARAGEILAEGVLLSSRGNRLHSPVPGVQHAVARLVRRLIEDETASSGSGTGLSIRPREHSARTLHLLPLAHSALRAKLAGDACVAIFVSGAQIEQDLARDVLRSMFELTDAELTVFRLIHMGRGTSEIAAELRVAISTVRTHVLHLFQKTGTHSRADLVRLAHAFTRPVAGMDEL